MVMISHLGMLDWEAFTRQKQPSTACGDNCFQCQFSWLPFTFNNLRRPSCLRDYSCRLLLSDLSYSYCCQFINNLVRLCPSFQDDQEIKLGPISYPVAAIWSLWVMSVHLAHRSSSFHGGFGLVHLRSGKAGCSCVTVKNSGLWLLAYCPATVNDKSLYRLKGGWKSS